MIAVAGEGLKKGVLANPLIKWAVIGLVAVFAVEVLGERGIDLYVKMSRAPVEAKRGVETLHDPATVFRTKTAEQDAAEHEKKIAAARVLALASPIVTAPDGRRVYSIGVISKGRNEGENTEALPDRESNYDRIRYGDVLYLYRLNPDLWIAAK